MKTYTLEDFLDMTLPELFGFWCIVKLDHIELPEPKDYSEIYLEFTDAQVSKVCAYLANEGINKAVATNRDGHDI